MIQLYWNLWQKKWIEINYLSSGHDSVNRNIRFKTSILRSNSCDYINAFIIVKGKITVEVGNGAKKTIKTNL